MNIYTYKFLMCMKYDEDKQSTHQRREILTNRYMTRKQWKLTAYLIVDTFQKKKKLGNHWID